LHGPTTQKKKNRDMKKYIDADKLFVMLEKMTQDEGEINTKTTTIREIQGLIVSLQMAQPEADLKLIENDAELIANKIMIGVQSNRYHTCIYNTERNDFNHSHLVQAARRGIELGLNARKEE